MDEAHSLIVAYDMVEGQAIADTPFAGSNKGDSSQVSYPNLNAVLSFAFGFFSLFCSLCETKTLS